MSALQMLMASKGVTGPAPAVSINPPETITTSNTDFANASTFTASFTGGTPSSIVWSVEDINSATAAVISGQGTASATIRLVTDDSGGGIASGSCTVRCTAIIGGVSKSGIAFKEHDFYYGGLEP